MNRAAVALLVALAFASGAGSGFVVARSRAIHESAAQIPSRFEILDAMAEEVGLSAAQHQKCREIQDRYHPRVVSARARIADELAAIRSSARTEMRGVLETDEQRRRFDAFCTRRDQQRAVTEK